MGTDWQNLRRQVPVSETEERVEEVEEAEPVRGPAEPEPFSLGEFAADLLCLMGASALLGLTVWGVMEANPDRAAQALRAMPLVLPLLMYLYRPRLIALVLYPGRGTISMFEVGWVAAWPPVTEDNRHRLEPLLRRYVRWNLAWALLVVIALQVHISGAAPASWVAQKVWWDILALLGIHILYRIYFFMRSRQVA